MRTIGEIRHTLWFQLTAAFLVVATVGVLLVALLANRATSLGFRHYLNQDLTARWADLPDQLATYYARQDNWEGIEAFLAAAGPERGQGEGTLVLLDESEQVVAIAGGRRNAPTNPAEANAALPVMVDGQQVGTLLINQPGGEGGGTGEQFLRAVNQAILWGGVVAMLLALFLGIFLARHLTRPLRRLTTATHKVAQGELGQQVPANTQGELGDLTSSFNQMSVALATYEQQRQQMLADIAHELRTPLSIMRGHMEAMLDGVFAMNADNLAVVHEETLLLSRLVEDLRTLSLAEAGQLSLNRMETNLTDIIKQSLAAFEPLAEAEGVKLVAVTPAEPVIIDADPNRLRQVLGNLLANALRHVHTQDNKHPQVRVTLHNHSNWAVLRVLDNGPGLSPEAQQHLFDRFWRADSARSRDQGGSGLGLAICQAIVEAHDGHIWVESAPAKGTAFIIEIPAAQGQRENVLVFAEKT